jgi:hypothetical protein
MVPAKLAFGNGKPALAAGFTDSSAIRQTAAIFLGMRAKISEISGNAVGFLKQGRQKRLPPSAA